jgi:hypothetical protein
MKTEDPLLNPYSPGECLARLARLRGVLLREEWIAQALPATTGETLREAAEALTLALESGDTATVQHANETAGQYLQQLFETACQPGLWNENATRAFEALGFPDPLASTPLRAVDISTVVVTHSQPERQVMTTISFEHAPGAKAYRLRTTRFIEGEDVLDDTHTCLAPVFRRMRIPAGTHRVHIESRDHSGTANSEEFTIEVPAPTGK